MQIRRFRDIIAVKDDTALGTQSGIVAFHAKNLEVAEITPELYAEMSEISLMTGEYPPEKPVNNDETNKELIDWSEYLNPDAKDGPIGFGIRSVTININQLCNLHCNYCAAGGDGTYGDPITKISIERTFPQLSAFVSKLKPGAKFSVTFVGGEPLLNVDAVSAIYYYTREICHEKNLRSSFSLVTNGTLFNAKNLNILRKLEIHVTVSMDGTKEVNDIVRPSKNGFSPTDQIVAGLKQLSEDRGKILSIGISAVVTDKSTNMLVNYTFFELLNPDWVEFNFPYSEKSAELQKIYLDGINNIAAKAWNAGGEAGLRKIKLFDHYFKMLDTQQRIENHCGAGKSYLMIDSRNNLYSCPWEVGKPGEIVGKGEQLDTERLSKYSKSLIELNNCTSCWARYLCGGGCMYIHKEHTGDKHQKDILFCERTRSLLLTVFLYYKLARSADL